MALSRSGNSNSSSISITGLQNSGSDSDLRQQDIIDERKRKRKQSNRESARRSRMRKQKHLDDLTAQVTLLLKENAQIVARIAGIGQDYVTIEAENDILRAQLLELNHRLQSLNEIVYFVESLSMETSQRLTDDGGAGEESGGGGGGVYDGVMNLGFYNQPIIMASASTTASDVFKYCY